MRRPCSTLIAMTALMAPGVSGAQDSLREEALSALTRATAFYREKVARHGGYQYLYSEDLTRSFGEIRRGAETAVTVQPPGTPSVGMVFLDAYEATGDRVHLEGALKAARCLLEGQLRSGGWGYGVEYDPELRRTHAYRVEPEAPGQDNLSVLDDNTTQFALRFMMRLDGILEFEDEAIHEAVEYALDSLLKAQYPNGAWPQRYDSPPDPEKHPVKKAGYPASWSRTHPGPHYKRHYTFNDNAIANAIQMLFEAGRVYGDERYRSAARKGADFILLAQLPEPQPAWAQQYDADMHPTWARRFEPPAVSGRESQDILLALLDVYRETGDPKYLDPVAGAIDYLRRSLLSDGRVARFYELKTNEPLYFTTDYELTYSDSDLPTHYRFKVVNRLDGIEAEYERVRARGSEAPGAGRTTERPMEELRHLVRVAIAGLDDQGRWLEAGTIPPSKSPTPSSRVIKSATFVRHASVLCEFLRRPKGPACRRDAATRPRLRPEPPVAHPEHRTVQSSYKYFSFYTNAALATFLVLVSRSAEAPWVGVVALLATTTVFFRAAYVQLGYFARVGLLHSAGDAGRVSQQDARREGTSPPCGRRRPASRWWSPFPASGPGGAPSSGSRWSRRGSLKPSRGGERNPRRPGRRSCSIPSPSPGRSATRVRWFTGGSP